MPFSPKEPMYVLLKRSSTLTTIWFAVGWSGALRKRTERRRGCFLAAVEQTEK
ncbi:hypothetical protein RUM43_002603, partial [Polyplax serrata]